MKHTECEDCKLRNGDCGYHFKMNRKGKTNYDIPSLTACDKYGNCMFFQQKEKPQGDLISREALYNEINTWGCNDYDKYDFLEAIDNAPSVIPDNDIFEWCTDCKEYDQEKHCCHRWSSKIRETIEEVKQCKLDELRPKGEWVEKEETPASVSYYCSNCKFEGLPITPYCPWCGAEMGGKDE